MKFFIYGLFDVDQTAVIRYVGAASNIKRPEAHAYEADRYPEKRSHKLNWIRSVRAIRWRVLQECSSRAELMEAERAWIAEMRIYLGRKLTNETAGGEGFSELTPEAKGRWRESIKRAHARPETKARYLAGFRRPEVIAKHSASATIALSRPGIRKKISDGVRRSQARPEVRARIAAGIRASWVRPEIRAKRKATLEREDVKVRFAVATRAAWGRPNIRARFLEKKSSQAFKSSVSNKLKSQWADPAFRARRSAEIKAWWARRKNA